MAQREAALQAALDDMIAWLRRPESQVAVFDATNSTEGTPQQAGALLLRRSRRRKLVPCDSLQLSLSMKLACHRPLLSSEALSEERDSRHDRGDQSGCTVRRAGWFPPLLSALWSVMHCHESASEAEGRQSAPWPTLH